MVGVSWLCNRLLSVSFLKHASVPLKSYRGGWELFMLTPKWPIFLLTLLGRQRNVWLSEAGACLERWWCCEWHVVWGAGILEQKFS